MRSLTPSQISLKPHTKGPSSHYPIHHVQLSIKKRLQGMPKGTKQISSFPQVKQTKELKQASEPDSEIWN